MGNLKLNLKILFVLCIFLSLENIYAMTGENGVSMEDKLKHSDHYKDGVFFNPTLPEQKSFFEVLKWSFTREKTPWPDHVEQKKFPRNNEPVNANEARITFINHSTFLIEFKNINILTDPIWSVRASPVSFAGPKRVKDPGLDIQELPKIDAVLISHNHYDHLDLASLKTLNDKFSPKFFVGLGDKKLLENAGITNVTELDWNDTINLNKETKITYLKCRHWSARGLFDRFKSLWGAYLIQNVDTKIYFGGDTGYAEHFKEAAAKYSAIDISLLPVGAYEPRWFMKAFHMNPEEGLMAAKDLNSKYNFGMHLETFQLTDEGFDEPRKEVERLLKTEPYKNIHMQLLLNGESFLYKKGN